MSSQLTTEATREPQLKKVVSRRGQAACIQVGGLRWLVLCSGLPVFSQLSATGRAAR